MGWGERAHAPPVTDRAGAARRASCGEVGFGTCRGERKADAARGLDDTGGDFNLGLKEMAAIANARFGSIPDMQIEHNQSPFRRMARPSFSGSALPVDCVTAQIHGSREIVARGADKEDKVAA
jgi:hypothetical protein